MSRAAEAPPNPPAAPPPQAPACAPSNTHPLLQALPLLQSKRVGLGNDGHDVDLVVYRLHERDI